jgi:TRAP-type C4-dicarboxylate transport system permease small subunit
MHDATGGRPAVLAALGRANAALLFLCKWLSIVLVAAIAVIVIASVVFRYGLNDSIAWAEDAAKFLMVWLAFIGAPLGFRHGAHVSIELLPPLLPAALHPAFRFLVHAAVLALMVVLAWQSWLFAVNGWAQVALTIGDLSMFWIFLSMPIGSAVMASVSLELLLTTLFGLPEPMVSEEETISTQGM